MEMAVEIGNGMAVVMSRRMDCALHRRSTTKKKVGTPHYDFKLPQCRCNNFADA